MPTTVIPIPPMSAKETIIKILNGSGLGKLHLTEEKSVES